MHCHFFNHLHNFIVMKSLNRQRMVQMKYLVIFTFLNQRKKIQKRVENIKISHLKSDSKNADEKQRKVS